MNVDVDVYLGALLVETERDTPIGPANGGLLVTGWTAGGVLPRRHAVPVGVERLAAARTLDGHGLVSGQAAVSNAVRSSTRSVRSTTAATTAGPVSAAAGGRPTPSPAKARRPLSEETISTV